MIKIKFIMMKMVSLMRDTIMEKIMTIINIMITIRIRTTTMTKTNNTIKTNTRIMIKITINKIINMSMEVNTMNSNEID